MPCVSLIESQLQCSKQSSAVFVKIWLAHKMDELNAPSCATRGPTRLQVNNELEAAMKIVSVVPSAIDVIFFTKLSQS